MERASGDSWTIEFRGLVIVTDRDGSKRQECVEQTWTFSDDGGFVVTISFALGNHPRVSFAGSEGTPAETVGEVIASTIRATRAAEPDAARGRSGG